MVFNADTVSFQYLLLACRVAVNFANTTCFDKYAASGGEVSLRARVSAANEFPAQFGGVVRRVVRLLFHVVAHMYAAHFRQLALLGLHAHLHLTFAHLTALDRRFALLDHKETEVTRT